MKRHVLFTGLAFAAGLLAGGFAIHRYEQRLIKKARHDAFEEGFKTKERQEQVRIRTYRFFPNEYFPKGEIKLGVPNYIIIDNATAKRDANLREFFKNLTKLGFSFPYDSTTYPYTNDTTTFTLYHPFSNTPNSKIFEKAEKLMPSDQFLTFKDLVGDTTDEVMAWTGLSPGVIGDLMHQSNEQRGWYEEQEKLWENQEKEARKEDSLLDYQESLAIDLFGPDSSAQRRRKQKADQRKWWNDQLKKAIGKDPVLNCKEKKLARDLLGSGDTLRK